MWPESSTPTAADKDKKELLREEAADYLMEIVFTHLLMRARAVAATAEWHAACLLAAGHTVLRAGLHNILQTRTNHLTIECARSVIGEGFVRGKVGTLARKG